VCSVGPKNRVLFVRRYLYIIPDIKKKVLIFWRWFTKLVLIEDGEVVWVVVLGAIILTAKNYKRRGY